MENKPFGIRFFGVVNIIAGGLYVLVYFIPFLVGVILGVMTDRAVLNFWHWFSLYITDRISIAIIFISSLGLFKSGKLLLRLDQRARKLAVISSVNIILGEILYTISAFIKIKANNSIELDYANIYGFLYFLFLFYLSSQIFLLTRFDIKKQFKDEGVRLNFIIPILIILVSFAIPFIFYKRTISY